MRQTSSPQPHGKIPAKTEVRDLNTILLVVLVILNALVLFWKPWLRAYGAEKAKNYARQEDLEKILSEVRAVTVATKEIEAKISGDLWNKQMIWTQRRDLYGRILDVHHQLSVIISEMRSGDDTPAKYQALYAQLTEVLHLFSLASIFANKRCCEALRSLLKARPTDFSAYENQVDGTKGSIILAAKEDLGIEARAEDEPVLSERE